MGLLTCFSVYAGHRHGADRINDPREASIHYRRNGWLVGGIIFALATPAALAQTTIRVATYDVSFSRKGPRLLLRDIMREKSEDVLSALAVIAHVKPDVLLLTGIDYDLSNQTVWAFSDALGAEGISLTNLFSAQPNTGLQTGLDMNGDDRLGSARDAQGYGRYAGAKDMAVLSTYPIDIPLVRNFTNILWKDLPDAALPTLDGKPFPSFEAQSEQRLSTTAHWDIPITTTEGVFHLFAYSATPPVFDGPEDMNGKRSADETRFWNAYLEGKLPEQPPAAPFVILGKSNIDPSDGDGIASAMQGLIDHPRVVDPMPASEGGREAANINHIGDPALDTAFWDDANSGSGNLRVDCVLPSSELEIVDSGVFWPLANTPEAELLDGDGATRHRLVWVDIKLP